MPDKQPLRLFAGTRLIGFLEPDHSDFPRVYAAFRAAKAFDDVRALFDLQNDSPSLEEVSSQMDALDLRIVDPDGREDPLFTIVIDGERAMWRMGFLRATKVARHDSFWKVMGDEIGPRECREPGCSRLKIGQSAFCKRHHFRMIMGEEYEGSLE